MTFFRVVIEASEKPDAGLLSYSIDRQEAGKSRPSPKAGFAPPVPTVRGGGLLP
jgi:hypothetical protein